MSSWRFLIIHTCRAEVASDHMGSQAWRQLPHLLVKRVQTEPAAEAGGPLSLCKGQISVCEHTVRLCTFICACTLEQKGKWKQITVMGVDAARWTHGEPFCGETRNRPGPDCQLPVIIVMLQKSTKKANHLYEWHIYTHTQMAKDKKCIELMYTLWPEIVLAWAGLKREFLDFFT